jgi:hypothetical protein
MTIGPRAGPQGLSSSSQLFKKRARKRNAGAFRAVQDIDQSKEPAS